MKMKGKIKFDNDGGYDLTEFGDLQTMFFNFFDWFKLSYGTGDGDYNNYTRDDIISFGFYILSKQQENEEL